MIKHIYSLVLLLSTVVISRAQVDSVREKQITDSMQRVWASRRITPLDSAELKEYIYNRMYKNIVAFNIRYPSWFRNGTNPKIPLTDARPHYEPFFADPGFRLRMKIENTGKSYVLPGYILYHIEVGTLFFEDTVRGETTRFGVPFAGMYYLIAVNNNSEFPNIKFISGQIFTHSIVNDVKFRFEDTASCKQYLALKLFDRHVANLQLKKSTRHTKVFSAYCASYDRPCTIELRKEAVETPIIRFKKQDRLPSY